MRYFIRLSYKGTTFHGWQRQNNASTVQDEIEKTLQIVLRETIEIVGCGRTDTGVHAYSYFAHFDTKQVLNKSILQAFNSVLPDDISIFEIFTADEDTHARFSATSRSYQYFIHYVKNPFLTDRSYHYRMAMMPDVDIMNEFCQKLIHVEDFTSFEKKGSDNTHGRCTVTSAEWRATENGIVFEVHANRFLRNMVRALVGTSLMIGCKKRKIEDIMQEIARQEPIHLAMTAPAHGLHLWSIDYPKNSFQSL